jgi:hypothetical protein
MSYSLASNPKLCQMHSPHNCFIVTCFVVTGHWLCSPLEKIYCRFYTPPKKYGAFTKKYGAFTKEKLLIRAYSGFYRLTKAGRAYNSGSTPLI